MRVATLAVALVALASIAEAHVSVSPRQSAAGASERYTVRVPTEGQVATVTVELEIPAAVTVTDVPSGSGFTVDTRREGGRVVAIVWTQEIKPGQHAEFVFVATNPKTGTQISWKAHQRFEDGTTADWVGPTGDRRPAASTALTRTP